MSRSIRKKENKDQNQKTRLATISIDVTIPNDGIAEALPWIADVIRRCTRASGTPLFASIQFRIDFTAKPPTGSYYRTHIADFQSGDSFDRCTPP